MCYLVNIVLLGSSGKYSSVDVVSVVYVLRDPKLYTHDLQTKPQHIRYQLYERVRMQVEMSYCDKQTNLGTYFTHTFKCEL